MAVAFESAGPVVYVGTAASSIDTVPPSGVAVGDLLILHHNQIDSGTSPPDTPAGWTYIGGRPYWFNTYRIDSYFRIATGGASDAPTVTVAGGGSLRLAAQISRYSGHDPDSPIAASAFIDDDVSPMTHPSVDALADGSMAEIFGASYLGETGSYTVDNGFVLVAQHVSGNPAFWVGTKSVDAGPTGTTDVTNSTTLLRCATSTIVIAPAAGGGPTEVSADLQALYRVAGLASAGLEAPFNARSLVRADSRALYRVSALAHAELQALFLARGLAGADMGAQFHVHGLARSDTGLRFAVRGLASAEIDSRFLAHALADSEVELLYQVEAPLGTVGASLHLLYAVRQLATASLQAPHLVSGLASVDFQTLSMIRSLARNDLQSLFRVAGVTSADLDLLFQMLAADGTVASSLSTPYRVRQVAGASLQALYRVKALAAQMAELDFRVNGLSGSSLELTYRSRALAASDIALLYRVRQLSAADLRMLYRVSSTIPFAGAAERTLKVAAFARSIPVADFERVLKVASLSTE